MRGEDTGQTAAPKIGETEGNIGSHSYLHRISLAEITMGTSALNGSARFGQY